MGTPDFCPRLLSATPRVSFPSCLLAQQAQSLLQCFREVVVGNLSSVPSSTTSSFGGGGGLRFNGSSSALSAYRVPPSEFLKVLLEGNLTRLRALHAVLEVMWSLLVCWCVGVNVWGCKVRR